MPTALRRRHRQMNRSASDHKRIVRSALARRCPCGKVDCRTEADAIELHAMLVRERGDANGSPVRFYRCESGSWHWTRAVSLWERLEAAKRNAVGEDCSAGRCASCWGYAWSSVEQQVVSCSCCAGHAGSPA